MIQVEFRCSNSISYEGCEGRVLDGKDKFALRDEEDVLGNVYPKHCCVEGRVRDVKAELEMRKRSLLWDFVSVLREGRVLLDCEGQVRIQKFRFVLFLLSLLGDSS